jgi:hypothetical protein
MRVAAQRCSDTSSGISSTSRPVVERWSNSLQRVNRQNIIDARYHGAFKTTTESVKATDLTLGMVLLETREIVQKLLF